jgi:hypothetical protein
MAAAVLDRTGARDRRTPRRAAGGESPRRDLAIAVTGTFAVTLAAAAIGAVWPGLAASTRPHAVLHGTLGDGAGILATNARVFAAPFLLAVCRWPSHHVTRRLGCAIITTLIGENAIAVGLELGRWRAQILPYLPHLPAEWLALSTASAAWLAACQGAERRTVTRYAAAVLILAVVAAGCETLLTPRAPDRTAQPTSIGGLPVTGAWPVQISDRWRFGVDCLHPQCAPEAARLASRSLRSLPLASLGSARPPSRRRAGYVNHPDPHRRDHP